jgi:hypothetical protein
VYSVGRSFSAENNYFLHFDSRDVSPVNAFLSLTLYDSDFGFAVDNDFKPNAIGDRDELKFNDNGSLDLYIQDVYSGVCKESNRLPAPEKKRYKLNYASL